MIKLDATTYFISIGLTESRDTIVMLLEEGMRGFRMGSKLE
jgi:hypothetical protein